VLKSFAYLYKSVNSKDFLVGNFGLRFHFNGQETDDEIAGKGNINTAEYWESDTRLGRRWNIDPIMKYQESPYSAFANNPIWFVDISGADTGDVVVGFGGGDITGTKNAGIVPDMMKKINEEHMNKEGGKAQAFHSQYWGTSPDDKKSLDKATQEAYDFIKANYNKDDKGNDVKGGRILLYGYSYGGVMATHLADRLSAAGLNVDVLYTIDAAAGPETDNVTRSISPKVRTNMNLYQSTSSSVGSHGAVNTSQSANTRIYNVLLKNTNHGDIDDITKNAVINSMIKILNIPPPRK